MGTCGAGQQRRKIAPTEKSSQDMIFESMQIDSEMHQLDKSIANASKSICKIFAKDKVSSGFLIKLFKRDQDFFCLITCEHVITTKMIKKRNTINMYYDNESKSREIKLNPDERFIKAFTDITMDATVVEILPKDNISSDYFLSTFLDYKDNFDALAGKDIAIIQYPKGELNYSYGKIKEITNNTKYEFAHSASTEEGSSGSPIFLKGATKVIGIHKGGNDLENFADFIWPIFNYFKNFSSKKKEINIIKNNNIINNANLNKNKNERNEPKELEIIPNNQNNNNLNQMNIIYEIIKNIEGINIFGSKFVENNEDNCYLLIDNEQRELCSYFKLEKKLKEKNELAIKLIERKNITNMSYMFGYCSSLKSLPDISNWNTKNVTNMSGMFSFCSSLTSLPAISKWETKNVTDMSYMFYNCKSLESLPDISNWNTKNVTDMSFMFGDCKLLKSIPDISKWDTKNVTNMKYMFSSCSSLKSLPDISNWDTKNVTDMSFMFGDCKSLRSLPDISKWDTTNVNNMKYMFNFCLSLKSMPDTTRWQRKNTLRKDDTLYN